MRCVAEFKTLVTLVKQNIKLLEGRIAYPVCRFGVMTETINSLRGASIRWFSKWETTVRDVEALLHF